ncbi:MAG: phosphoadenosine phosphosulfate reductase, partial [Paracoccaceae bacterium]|nr:phosphoadenosine phosphosulfate reductase [Paracoccaceae bacterium]
MQDARNADAKDTTSTAEWFQRIEEIGEELGYFEPLGAKHSAFFVDDTATLLVTFETVANIREKGEGQMPLGHTIAKAQGWSHLCIIADGDTWYRDVAVYRFFDR